MQHVINFSIGNNIQSARVTPVNHPHHQVCHVLFEDGYENIFFTDPETGNWLEEDLGETQLAIVFGKKATGFLGISGVSTKVLSWCTASIAGMTINFGFFLYMERGRAVFEVYAANRKFLCNLVKGSRGKWVIYGSQRPAMEYQYINQLQVLISILEGMADRK